jgi:hypothetical protein
MRWIIERVEKCGGSRAGELEALGMGNVGDAAFGEEVEFRVWNRL